MQIELDTQFWIFHSTVIDEIPYDDLTTDQGTVVDDFIELHYMAGMDVNTCITKIKAVVKTLLKSDDN